jgi:hypothetical protein
MGFCIPEDGILHSHRRENLKSYIFNIATHLTLSDKRATLRIYQLRHLKLYGMSSTDKCFHVPHREVILRQMRTSTLGR